MDIDTWIRKAHELLDKVEKGIGRDEAKDKLRTHLMKFEEYLKTVDLEES